VVVLKVLIADDNEDSRNLLVKQLQAHGHEVVAVADGAEALEQAVNEKPDIIVSDIMMPDMDGFQLCRLCKQIEQVRHIPFVFYTSGYTSDKDEQFGLSLGASAFIRKPADSETLSRILLEVCEKAKSGLLSPSEVAPLEQSLFFDEYSKRFIANLDKKVAQLEKEVTERKKAEEALREIEEKLRLTFESVTEGITVTDLNGNVIDINEAVVRMHGYDSKEQVIGRSAFRLMAERDHARATENLTKTLEEGQSGTVEYTLLRKDGSEFPGELSADLVRDTSGNPIRFVAISRDITERKLAERELENIFNLSPDMLAVCTPEGKFLKVSPSWENTLGYKIDEILKLGWAKLVHPDDAEITGKEVEKQLEGEPVMNFINRFRCKDGTYRILEWRASPAEEGIVYAVARDITERKRAEEILQESEEKLNRVFDAIEYAVIISDMEGKITDENEAALGFQGYSCKEEVIGRWGFEFISEKDRLRAIQEGMAAIERGHGSVEAVFVTKDGKEYDAETTANVLHDASGNAVGFVSVTRDVTERKRAEEALRDSEEKYRALVDQMDEGFAIIRGNRIRFVNERYAEIVGEPVDKLIGERYDKFVALEELEQARQISETVTAGGKVTRLYEFISVKDDGRRVPYEVSFREVTYEGEPSFAVVMRDITDRRRAEEKEKELQQELTIASRLATVGEMASGIAHEINNPLTGVVGYAGLLLKKDIPEDIRKNVNIIFEEAKRVANITNRLLIFARQQKPELTSVNVNDIIETTLAMRAYETESSNIKVTTRLASDMPLTFADAAQLQQVFLNIVLNAETEMRNAHDKGCLSVKTERIDNTIRISFKDDGLGISKENLERIFDPFFTTREVGKGAGLGLSVSHGIVIKHGGRIYARSRLGKGATFFVELPIITKAEQLESDEPAAGDVKRVYEARILVVDDDSIIQQFLTKVLGEEGYEVETTENGEDALERIGSEDYDVILLDVKLPGMSGIELYKYIQKAVKSKARRVIFITGDVMSKDAVSFLSRSRAPFIIKPFDAEQIKRAVDRILVEGA